MHQHGFLYVVCNENKIVMIRRFKTGIKKVYAALTLATIEILVVLIAFIAALFSFVLIARMIFWKKKTTIDFEVFDFLTTYVSDVNTGIMRVFSFLGTHYFLIPANLLIIGYFLFVRKHRWYSIKVPVISLSSMLLMFFLKNLFGRERPLIPLLQEAKGLSFPSGHAMMSFAFYGLIIYIVYENVKTGAKWLMIAGLMLTILFIGISRVYLRVHYASDVLAGFCLGLMWLVFSLFILNRMERFSKKEVDYVVDKEPA